MSLTTKQKMDALGNVLYGETKHDWELTVHHTLTEPTCPVANVQPEGMQSTRYACFADTVEEAIAASVNAAYREWVEERPGERMVPWSQDNCPIEKLLRARR